tara:strand:+ start:159 stop:1235 length:1077 start_codon:yes stop_codon:yes gene_type:complete
MLKVLDLFAGIGGFSLGLEMTGGFETVAFCEIEKYPQEILKKNFLDVPIYEDVRELTADRLIRDGIGRIDVITGGYPCQPFSVAGKQKGEADDRHLWPFMLEIIAQVRPSWVICENVSGHIALGLDQVLFDLENKGYASRTFVVPACAVNAPHRRDRLWIVAHAECNGFAPAERGRGVKKAIRRKQKGSERTFDTQGASGLPATREDVAHANSSNKRSRERSKQQEGDSSGQRASDGGDVAHTHGAGFKQSDEKVAGKSSEQFDSSGVQPGENALADSVSSERERSGEEQLLRERDLPGKPGRSSKDIGEIWSVEPNVGRVADGIPRRVAKLKALGNAVVPQIPMMIGQAILDYENDN